MTLPAAGTRVVLPSRAVLRQTLEDGFRRDVVVGDGSRVFLDPPSITAVFVDRRLAMVALLVLDSPLACTLAGLELRRSSTWVRQQIHSGEQDDRLRQGVTGALEVLLPVVAARHAEEEQVHLYGLHGRHRRVPTDVAALAAHSRLRDDVLVQVPGFGRGRMTVVLPEG